MLNMKWSGKKLIYRIAFVFIPLFIHFPVSLVAGEGISKGDHPGTGNGTLQQVKVSGVVVDNSEVPVIGCGPFVAQTRPGRLQQITQKGTERTTCFLCTRI